MNKLIWVMNQLKMGIEKKNHENIARAYNIVQGDLQAMWGNQTWLGEIPITKGH